MRMKKFISFLITAVTLLTLLPTLAYASDSNMGTEQLLVQFDETSAITSGYASPVAHSEQNGGSVLKGYSKNSTLEEIFLSEKGEASAGPALAMYPTVNWGSATYGSYWEFKINPQGYKGLSIKAVVSASDEAPQRWSIAYTLNTSTSLKTDLNYTATIPDGSEMNNNFYGILYNGIGTYAPINTSSTDTLVTVRIYSCETGYTPKTGSSARKGFAYLKNVTVYGYPQDLPLPTISSPKYSETNKSSIEEGKELTITASENEYMTVVCTESFSDPGFGANRVKNYSGMGSLSFTPFIDDDYDVATIRVTVSKTGLTTITENIVYYILKTEPPDTVKFSYTPSNYTPSNVAVANFGKYKGSGILYFSADGYTPQKETLMPYGKDHNQYGIVFERPPAFVPYVSSWVMSFPTSGYKRIKLTAKIGGTNASPQLYTAEYYNPVNDTWNAFSTNNVIIANRTSADTHYVDGWLKESYIYFPENLCNQPCVTIRFRQNSINKLNSGKPIEEWDNGNVTINDVLVKGDLINEKSAKMSDKPNFSTLCATEKITLSNSTSFAFYDSEDLTSAIVPKTDYTQPFSLADLEIALSTSKIYVMDLYDDETLITRYRYFYNGVMPFITYPQKNYSPIKWGEQTGKYNITISE